MYTIKYQNEKNEIKGPYQNIKSITLDKSDIMMMQYIDLLYGGDKNLIILYLKYLKYCLIHRENVSKFTIENNTSSNEKIISNILSTEWLINENSLSINNDEYQKRKEIYEKELIRLRGSQRTHDVNTSILMKYFIDTLNENLEKEKIKLKDA